MGKQARTLPALSGEKNQRTFAKPGPVRELESQVSGGSYGVAKRAHTAHRFRQGVEADVVLSGVWAGPKDWLGERERERVRVSFGLHTADRCSSA